MYHAPFYFDVFVILNIDKKTSDFGKFSVAKNSYMMYTAFIVSDLGMWIEMMYLSC